MGKFGSEKTPCFEIIHAANVASIISFQILINNLNKVERSHVDFWNHFAAFQRDVKVFVTFFSALGVANAPYKHLRWRALQQ